MSIIKADNVSIRYMTGDFKSIGLKEYVVRRIKGTYRVTEFWADRHVSFSLEKGDMLGIIGTNGAGKSTLLKAVSGIMLPTEGSMEINGNVAALLELGSGFDGDLTVKENTYLRGAMLGYTREFMDEMYDQIIAFAELEEFQERAFKQLSSGMKSRLAFSIACLVSPDILILDEVLSVGDGAFRKKSGDKMKEILANGVTGILVSHNMGQVRELCNKILWLDHGKQIAFTDEVTLHMDAYQEFLQTRKLPTCREDIEKLAEDYAERTAREQARRRQMEQNRIKAAIESGENEAALNAALDIIRKTKPELLIENKVEIGLNTDGKPMLRWEYMDGVAKYEIWRSRTGEIGSFGKIFEVPGTVNIYTNKQAVEGETYYYKVKAIYTNPKINRAYSSPVTITSK